LSKEKVLARYGLSSNPFEVRPLQPNEQDMNLFVGRDQQTNRLLNILEDMSDGIFRRLLVLGQVGVGKSSFMNRIIFELEKRAKPQCLCLTIEGGAYSTLEYLLIVMTKICDKLLSSNRLARGEKKAVSEIKKNLRYIVEDLSSTSATTEGAISVLIATLQARVTGKEEKRYQRKPYSVATAKVELEVLAKIALNHFDGILICIDEADRLLASDLFTKGRNVFFTIGCSHLLGQVRLR